MACRCFGARYAWVGEEQRLPRNQFDEDFGLRKFFGRPEPELELLEFTLQARADDPAEHRLQRSSSIDSWPTMRLPTRLMSI